MENLLNTLSYLQNNDKNGTYMDMLDEIEDGTLTIKDAKLECITILQGLYNECIEGNNFMIGNKIASLAMELQGSL